MGTARPISYRTQPLASIHKELLGVCSDPYRLAQQLTLVEQVRKSAVPQPRPTGHPGAPSLAQAPSQHNPSPEPVGAGPAMSVQRPLALEQFSATRDENRGLRLQPRPALTCSWQASPSLGQNWVQILGLNPPAV